MKARSISSLRAVAVVTSGSAAPAQDCRDRDRRWQGGRDGGWEPADHYRRGRARERRLDRPDWVCHGRDARFYCRRDGGTNGLVVGAVGGGLLANVLGGGTLAGAGGGALLGRSVDRGKVRCR